ncbi:MAG TPA: hypothetical protein VGD67_26410 [Pseudonocardiaceae bacterium]
MTDVPGRTPGYVLRRYQDAVVISFHADALTDHRNLPGGLVEALDSRAPLAVVDLTSVAHFPAGAVAVVGATLARQRDEFRARGVALRVAVSFPVAEALNRHGVPPACCYDSVAAAVVRPLPAS